MTPAEWDAHLRQVAAAVAAALRRDEAFGSGPADHQIADLCDRMAAEPSFARVVYVAVSAMCHMDAIYCDHLATLVEESVVVHLIHEVRAERALLKDLPTEGTVH